MNCKSLKGFEYERMIAGFLFDREGRKVVLVKKNRPEWQKGRLNGIGGHVEEGETPEQAMTREFEEEAGVYIKNWYTAVILKGNSWVVHFYYAYTISNLCLCDCVKTTTDEKIEIIKTAELRQSNTIFNLNWIIPICLDGDLKKPITIKEGEWIK